MTTPTPTVELACDLIRRQSLTPEDAGCQALMIERLKAIGFETQRLRFGEVENFWAIHGEQGPILAFAGHTDVVPSGPEQHWQHPPFEPVINAGILYGRGAADMKGSLAAMVTACERFISKYPDHKGRIAFLITSDEEGPAVDGTVKVMQWLQQQRIAINWCVVGEPSSSREVGDVIKNGRRGSLGATVTIEGIQGHVAYPHLADNPIHKLAPALAELSAEQWDQGNKFFPATTFQVSNINSGTGASNVIPPDVTLLCNFRFSTEVTAAQLQQRTETILNKHQLNYRIEWNLSGSPFLTTTGDLIRAVTDSIRNVTRRETQLSTAGGTSDGRFIAPSGAQVVEVGPVNATIHKVNECVRTQELDVLSDIYFQVLQHLLV